MKFTASYERKVNLGNYENATLGVSMEFDTDRTPPSAALEEVMGIVEEKVPMLGGERKVSASREG